MYNKSLIAIGLLLCCRLAAPVLAQTALPPLQEGIWRGQIATQGQQVPFNFEISQKEGKPLLRLINAGEKLVLDELRLEADSLHIAMHIFDAELVARVSNGRQMTGYFVKNVPGVSDYRLPFTATAGQNFRFREALAAPSGNVSGKWEVAFTNAEGKKTQAVGLFEQKGTRVTGTFLTPTGDYRYLEGELNADTLHLSTFVGESLMLFRAKLAADGSLAGDYWSGKAAHSTWVAKRNEQAQLPDAGKLTFLKPGYERIDFSFPNIEGQTVSLNAERYKGKVVIVQLLGSWCPNCMDETAFLAPYYKKHRAKGLEVVGLAYERSPKLEDAKPRLAKMKQRMGVEYEVLFAGTSDKEAASATLPMLNHVMAFPTTIYIDRQGKVRKVHTGFSGPGTGKYYEEFVEEFDKFIKGLLREK